MGVSEVPLVKQDFMEEPRKVVQLDVPFFKPEAHGHLLKLAKVGTTCLLWCVPAQPDKAALPALELTWTASPGWAPAACTLLAACSMP